MTIRAETEKLILDLEKVDSAKAKKLKALLEKEEQLKSEIAKAKTADASERRKIETRKAILLGKYVMQNAGAAQRLFEKEEYRHEFFFQFLTRDKDKELFKSNSQDQKAR